MILQETLKARRKAEECRRAPIADTEGIFLELAILSGTGRRDTGCGAAGGSVAGGSVDTRVGAESRADTELGAGAGKLSGRDKAMLSWVWTLALVYAIMTPQLLSKVTLEMIQLHC